MISNNVVPLGKHRAGNQKASSVSDWVLMCDHGKSPTSSTHNHQAVPSLCLGRG